jgi:hypothetical protein
LLRAISRHEIIRVTALLCSAARQRESRLSAFRSERIALPREAKRAIPLLQNETQKHEHDRKLQLNASTAEQHRQAIKFPPQPQEWKIVSLRECPTPEAMQFAKRLHRRLIIGEHTSLNIRISILNVNVWWF